MASVLPIQVSLSRRERNANINVGTFSETRKHSEKSRWICIYPAYINSRKKVSDGRRIPVNIAVENPTLAEMRDVLINAGLEVETEINKVYPRELDKYELLSRGRIRVHLKNDDGTPVNESFPTSKNHINEISMFS
jgi:signal recognition particle subunit SRP19